MRQRKETKQIVVDEDLHAKLKIKRDNARIIKKNNTFSFSDTIRELCENNG